MPAGKDIDSAGMDKTHSGCCVTIIKMQEMTKESIASTPEFSIPFLLAGDFGVVLFAIECQRSFFSVVCATVILFLFFFYFASLLLLLLLSHHHIFYYFKKFIINYYMLLCLFIVIITII